MFDDLTEEKRYRKNLVILFPICLLVGAVFTYLGRINMTPFWLNGMGGFLGAMIGGPIYGAIVLLVFTIMHMIFHFEMIYLLTIFPLIAGIVAFGFFTHIGYFRQIKGAFITTIVIAFVRTVTMTPILIATNGGGTVDNNFAEEIFRYLSNTISSIPVACLISQALANIIDSGIIVLVLFFLLHKFWKFWDRNFDIKAMEVVKIEVVEEKNLDVQ